jgi:hypothetical protein
MAITQAGAIGTSATTVYTSSGQTALTCLFFMNDNAASRTLDVHVVQSGGSASATNKIVKQISIDGGDTYVINLEKIVLDNGDTIQCVASNASSVYGTVSSVTI